MPAARQCIFQMGLTPQTPRGHSQGPTTPRRSGGARRARPRETHVKNPLVRERHT